jgi:hypothetical protein
VHDLDEKLAFTLKEKIDETMIVYGKKRKKIQVV